MDWSPSSCLHTTGVPSPKSPTEHQSKLSLAGLGPDAGSASAERCDGSLHWKLEELKKQLAVPASSQIIEKEQ